MLGERVRRFTGNRLVLGGAKTTVSNKLNSWLDSNDSKLLVVQGACQK